MYRISYLGFYLSAQAIWWALDKCTLLLLLCGFSSIPIIMNDSITVPERFEKRISVSHHCSHPDPLEKLNRQKRGVFSAVEKFPSKYWIIPGPVYSRVCVCVYVHVCVCVLFYVVINLFFSLNCNLMMSWCLMSSDVIWHIRDKLWPMPKHGSVHT